MDNPSFSDFDDNDEEDSSASETTKNSSISYKGEMIFALTSGGQPQQQPNEDKYTSSKNTMSPPSLPPVRPQSTGVTPGSTEISPEINIRDWRSTAHDLSSTTHDCSSISNDTKDRSHFNEESTTSEILRGTGEKLLQEEENHVQQKVRDQRGLGQSSPFNSFDRPTFEDNQKHYNSYSSINSNDRSLDNGVDGAYLKTPDEESGEMCENPDDESRKVRENTVDESREMHESMSNGNKSNCVNKVGRDESKASLEDNEKSFQRQTIETSKELMTTENTYSDGYFDQSIDKIYERYNKRKCLEESYHSRGSSGELPTGCFDETKDTQNGINQMSFFKRCTQKKYIVLSSTALCMMLATALAVILTVNVFHITGHNHHYHGDADKTAENSAEMYQKAAIASDSGNCSRIGVEILRKNGSAVDAAVTTAFCLGVTNRHASGIGGGGYMLVYDRANRSFEAFDFRETAPGRIQSNVYDQNINVSRYGGLAIGVPGEIRGLYTAWKKYGKLPWKDLVQPAIDLAKFGVAVTPSVHGIIMTMMNMIQADPGLSKLLLNANGEPLEVGANMIDEELAETLKVISEKPDDFYTGDLAAKVVVDVAEAGGIISFDDLAGYRVLNREVVHDTIDDLDLHTIGAPTGGPVVISLLNILKGYKLKPEDIDSKSKAPLTYHRLAEALKFAFALKTREGDPSFYREYMKELVSNMTNEEYGLVLRRKINDSMAQDFMCYSPTYNLPNENGTSHISVVTENGDAVSLTTTINQWYGSLNRSLRTGIIYNNEMNDFSMVLPQPNARNITESETLPQSPINSVHSGKRPVSSTSAIIMTDTQGDVRFVIGGTGGMRIIPSVAQVIINKLWFKQDLGTAMNTPRIYSFLQPTIIYVEPELEYIIEGLRMRNHTVIVVDPQEYTAVQAIYVERSGVYAKADRRKVGHTAGF